MLTGGPEPQGVDLWAKDVSQKRTLSRDLGPHPGSLCSMTLMWLIPCPLKARELGLVSSFPGESPWADTWYL